MDLAVIEALYPDHVAQQERLYAQALREAGFDAVVVHSGTPQKKTSYDDQYWPLRPTPFFHHWVALYEPGCFLVVEAGAKTRLYWPECKDFWERPPPPESTAFFDVLDVRRVAAPELPAGKRVAWLGDDTARAAALGIASADQNPAELLAALDRLRTTKTPYEIACLVEANRRAALGHEAVRRAFAESDRSELDLHLLYLQTTRQDDPETPYKNIVATGRNASILHHVSYGRDATRAESLLLDAGATCLGYCSDITRTWVKTGGAASAAFIAILEGMEAMQKRLVARVTAGAPYEDLHDESHRQVSAILKEAGVVKASADEIDAKGISRVFYPHGLGHSLGLQTHDVGCAVVKPKPENPFLRNTSRIAEGQVFTIEPGLYFVDSLLAPLRSTPEGKLVDWNLVEALSPLGGIRIEDDVLVTASGARNFSREVLPLGGGPLG
ncbi:MAG: Xaa-Pro dipeptidase [Labilithrix sp.]|nr:Xaa-Pro dipeptidase [Labilithrix sp.]MCW5835730.1 Xaa-Pro dipeptidase [Labilithrix sp.]